MSVIDEVRSRIDIVDVIGGYVKLNRSGRNYKGLSPFQNERSPSFFVFPDTQTYKDFSSGEQGDVFSFLMKKEGLTFGEALRELARRAGVPLEEHTPEQKKSADQETRLREALAAAAGYFHQLLLTAPQAQGCRAYIRDKRQLTADTVKVWEMGYSLMDYQALTNFLSTRGFSVQELIEAGLVIENDEGRRYDRFRGRLMIPIKDPKGQVVGFGSRSLDGSEPKYMNSPQTVVFDKGRLLFGMDKARNSIRSEQASVLVEGYMDVIGCHQAGFTNVVAGMGTSLSEDQFKMLKRLANRIVLALDPDAAGNRAVLRGVDVARESLDRETELVFDARGTIRQESKLNADIRVAVMPEGKDPDEIVLESPDQWRGIIANARPVVEHVIDVTLLGFDMSDPHAKSNAVRAVAPILMDTSDAVQRDFYIQQLSRRLQITTRAILQALNEDARELRAKRSTQQASAPAQKPSALLPDKTRLNQVDLEKHLVAALARMPSLLMDANVALTRAGLTVLGEEDFLNPAFKEGFRELSRAAMGQPLPPAGEESDDWLAMIADYEAIDTNAGDELMLREETVRTALRLRERNLVRERDSVNLMIEEAMHANEAGVASRYRLELHRVLTQLLCTQKALQLRSALNVT
jgi:DNA primase